MSSVVVNAWIGVVFLFIFFTWIGIKFSKISSTKDFLLMGRKVGFWMFFGAYTGSSIGGSSVAGYTGYGWDLGLSSIWVISVSGITVPLFAMIFAKKINVFGRLNNAYTIADFLAIRFGKYFQIPAMLIAYTRPAFITGLQFLALGLVFNVGFGIPLKFGVLIGAAVVILYVITGGQYSAIIAQWLQSILQGAGLLLLMGVTLYYNGGLSAGISSMYTNLSAAQLNVWNTDFSIFTVWIISMGVFYFVDPWLYQWAYMAKKPQTSSDALVAISLSSPWILISFLAGMLLAAAANSGALAFPAGTTPDQIFLVFISKMIHPLLGAFMLVAFLMTVMSCASSFLITGATVMQSDLYMKFINPNATEKQNIRFSRFFIILTSVFGIIAALWVPFLVPLWIIGQAIVVSGLLWPTLSAWFWKRATAKAAWASLCTGGLSSIGWAIYAWLKTGSPDNLIYNLHAVHIGLGLSLILMVVVSLLTKPDPIEMVNKTNWKKIPWNVEEG